MCHRWQESLALGAASSAALCIVYTLGVRDTGYVSPAEGRRFLVGIVTENSGETGHFSTGHVEASSKTILTTYLSTEIQGML